MKRAVSMIVAGLAVLLFALPAAAQDADPYGEVLPRDVEAPGEVTTPPDAEADAESDTRQRPAPAARAASGSLPRTGLGVTVGALLLAIALFAIGTGAVLTARRRSRTVG